MSALGHVQENPTGAEEMARIIVRVKPDQVRLQHSLEDLEPHWQDTEDLRTRKRGVEEEANLDIDHLANDLA